MDHLLVADRHHAERDVLRGHVVRALDLVDLVGLRHHDVVVLQDDGVGVHADCGLRVAVLSAHRQVESEGVRVDDVDVASLRPAQSVDSSVERLVRSDLNGDARILAVHRHIVARPGLITVDVGAREIVD